MAMNYISIKKHIVTNMQIMYFEKYHYECNFIVNF